MYRYGKTEDFYFISARECFRIYYNCISFTIYNNKYLSMQIIIIRPIKVAFYAIKFNRDWIDGFTLWKIIIQIPWILQMTTPYQLYFPSWVSLVSFYPSQFTQMTADLISGYCGRVIKITRFKKYSQQKNSCYFSSTR